MTSPKGRRRSIWVYDEPWQGLVALAAAEDRSVNWLLRRLIDTLLEDARRETLGKPDGWPPSGETVKET